MSARLAVESFAARAAARLSRVAGAGGGTTLPGKLLWKLDPGAIDALAARLPQGAAVVSATNGKTTTTAMVAEILGSRTRLAWNSSGANLVSGVASTLLAQRDAELGLLEVDEGALPEVVRRVRPRAILLGNLFRDQLDRYGELEHIAERWRAATASLPPDTVLVVNGDDPQVGDLADGRPGAIAFGIDDPRHARPALQHAADSRYCVRCGRPYEFAAAYVGHLGDYSCPHCGHARPALQVRATEIELDGLEAASFTLETPEGSIRLRLPLPGLYNVYNALGAAALAQALGTPLEEIRAGLERFGAAFGRFERIAVGDKRLLILLIKNPAGANEVVHTLLEGGAPDLLLVALNDAIADGKDVSWIWDVDFEPLLGRAERLIASGDRAAELAVRCVYGGLDEDALEVQPDLEQALDLGLELTPPGGELIVLPTYTAMLALQRIVTDRGLVQAVLGALVRIRVGHLYPDYLNIYADRGNIAVLDRRARLRGHELDVRRRLDGRRGAPRRARPPLHRWRTGSRAAARRAGPRREGPGDRSRGGRRRGAARRLRRLPAARPRLSRPARRVDARHRALPARDVRGRAAHDRRRAAGDASSSRESGGRSPASRTMPAGRGSTRAPSRSAASSPASGTTASPATRACASVGRSGRTCTARCCRGTPGSRTGSSRRRSRTRRAASRRSSSRCRTASKPRRTRSRRSEPATAAAASEATMPCSLCTLCFYA